MCTQNPRHFHRVSYVYECVYLYVRVHTHKYTLHIRYSFRRFYACVSMRCVVLCYVASRMLATVDDVWTLGSHERDKLTFEARRCYVFGWMKRVRGHGHFVCVCLGVHLFVCAFYLNETWDKKRNQQRQEHDFLRRKLHQLATLCSLHFAAHFWIYWLYVTIKLWNRFYLSNNTPIKLAGRTIPKSRPHTKIVEIMFEGFLWKSNISFVWRFSFRSKMDLFQFCSKIFHSEMLKQKPLKNNQMSILW